MKTSFKKFYGQKDLHLILTCCINVPAGEIYDFKYELDSFLTMVEDNKIQIGYGMLDGETFGLGFSKKDCKKYPAIINKILNELDCDCVV